MSKTTVRLTLLAACLLVAGIAGFTVMADDAGQDEPSLVARIHHHLAGLHGSASRHHGRAGHGLHAMHGVMHRLALRDDQRQRMHAVHETLLTGLHGTGDGTSHVAAFRDFIAQVETGTVDVTETTIRLERHIDSLRASLGAAAEEAVALVNGLDDDQRRILVDHLEALADRLE